MNSTERVKNTILGLPVDRQPIYGWVSANLSEEITEKWEPIILSAVIFLFVPMYNIAIIQLFQSISDANNSSE